jgi:HEPN domain-containing protein
MTDETMLDEEEYDRWRDEANRALQSARLDVTADLHNWACFGAEQAAQLAVKGLLHGLGRGPWGHDLVQFGQMIEEAGLTLPEGLIDVFRRLGRHYIPARYPDAHAAGPPGLHYGEADASEAIEDAEAILAFVDSAWKEAKSG